MDQNKENYGTFEYMDHYLKDLENPGMLPDREEEEPAPGEPEAQQAPRRKAGRPKGSVRKVTVTEEVSGILEDEAELIKRLTVVMPMDLYMMLRYLASGRCMTVSSYVRGLLLEDVEKHSEEVQQAFEKSMDSFRKYVRKGKGEV